MSAYSLPSRASVAAVFGVLLVLVIVAEAVRPSSADSPAKRPVVAFDPGSVSSSASEAALAARRTAGAAAPAQASLPAPASAPVADSPSAPPPPPPLPPVVRGAAPPNPYSDEQVRRGAFLVQVGGCNHCHTPWVFDPALGAPAPDKSRLLSGHPRGGPEPQGELAAGDTAVIGPTFTSFKLPFGTVYARNLTPDVDTGIGAWTEDMFVGVFERGKHMGGNGRPVLPPMPWENLHGLPREEQVAIFAYLRSLPPVRNAAPVATVPDEVLRAVDTARGRLIAATVAAR